MSSSTPRLEHDGPRRRLTILVADDESMIVSAIERFFTLRGHEVRTAADAEAARSLLESNRFDVALIDARMPGDGLSVVAHLEQDPDFEGRVVLMTGAVATDPSVQVGPGVARIQKPFRFADLVPIVEGDGQY